MKKTLLIMLAMVIGMTAIAYTVQAKQAKNETKATASMKYKIVIKGTITDSNGDPVIGASVQIKGKNTGVISDVDGNYTIEVEIGDVLIISYIGYKTRELKVVDVDQNGNVVLEEDTQILV